MAVSLDQARDAIRAIVRLNKFNSVVASLSVPVLVGVWAVFYERISAVDKVGPVLFWGPMALFILWGLLAAYGVYESHSAPEVYLDAVVAREQISRLWTDVSLLTAIQEHSLVLMAAIQGHLGLSNTDATTLKDVLTSICDHIANDRE